MTWTYPNLSFQLLKALKNGLFEFDGLRLFQELQYLQINWFTIGVPIETNHATSPRIHHFLIYYRDSHSNKLNNDLAGHQTQTDRSSRLLGVGSSSSDMFMSWVSTCLRCVFRWFGGTVRPRDDFPHLEKLNGFVRIHKKQCRATVNPIIWQNKMFNYFRNVINNLPELGIWI